jgi:hypothetical protein
MQKLGDSKGELLWKGARSILRNKKHPLDLRNPEFCSEAITWFMLQIKLSEYIGKKYVVVFFYPLDFTFVCPTGNNSESLHALDLLNVAHFRHFDLILETIFHFV